MATSQEQIALEKVEQKLDRLHALQENSGRVMRAARGVVILGLEWRAEALFETIQAEADLEDLQATTI